VFGGAGVGKTRLAEECLGIAQGARHTVARATATSLASQVPLGALAHLLARPDRASRGDVAAQFAAVVASVHEQAGSRRFVLLIDDLPLLDETSVVLVQRLLDAGDTFLLATARSGQSPSLQAQHSGALEVVRGDRVRRIDLEQHSRAELDAMVAAALGGEVVPATLLALWSVTLGNALFAREIVLAAQAQGALRMRHGVWHLSGRVPTVGQLGDAIDARLGQLAPDQRPPAELLAVAAPVELAELVDRFGPGPVEELERASVVRVVAAGSRQQVELAHPLYGERMRDAMASMTRRRVLADHLAWLDTTSTAEGRDAVRRAIWRLEALGTADSSLLMPAARAARYAHDYRSVERLARAVLAEGPSNAARLFLGQALADLGRFEEAEATLAEAQAGAAGDDELVQAVVARLRNFVWGLLRPADAEELARAAQALARSDATRDVLRAALGWVLVFSDRPAAALEIIEALGTDHRRGGELRVIAEACALVAAGRSEEAAAVARRGREIHIATSADVSRPGTHLATEVFALVECGRLAAAFEIGEAGYQVARQQRHPIGLILFTMTLGRAALVAGVPRTAKRWLAECDALCAKFRFDGPRRIVLSALATANSWLGEPDLARQAAAELAGLPPFGFMTPEQERGRAWAAVAAGELNAACTILAAAAAEGTRAGHHSSEALLLHDLVRLGRAGDVADRLTELARLGNARLLDAYALHARAAADDDPAALSEAAAALASIGAPLAAAEAATSAAQAWLRRGEPRSAANAQARAAALVERCEGARTPGLSTVAVSVALTRREREIATLAATGTASSAIAADLILSVRTVNNHLQHAYTKLGVTSRRELRAALGLTGGP
jgi:DNA-binding CsgD family transcriptional regulator